MFPIDIEQLMQAHGILGAGLGELVAIALEVGLLATGGESVQRQQGDCGDEDEATKLFKFHRARL